jgi:hypothetical protein
VFFVPWWDFKHPWLDFWIGLNGLRDLCMTPFRNPQSTIRNLKFGCGYAALCLLVLIRGLPDFFRVKEIQ